MESHSQVQAVKKVLVTKRNEDSAVMNCFLSADGNRTGQVKRCSGYVETKKNNGNFNEN